MFAENARNKMTLEELQRLGINAQSVTESLGKSTKGWVCDESDRVVAFSMADRATGEFLVIAVLPEYEGKGVGGKLMALAEDWLAASGCKRAWLTTDLDTTLRTTRLLSQAGLDRLEMSKRPTVDAAQPFSMTANNTFERTGEHRGPHSQPRHRHRGRPLN